MRILFVCTGNTCRNPMAAALLRKALSPGQKPGGSTIEVDSAGVAAGSDRASTGAMEIMQDYDIDLRTHQSKRLSLKIVNSADIILAMTVSHKTAIIRSYLEAKGKTFTLAEYVGKASDVEDPMVIGDYGKCAVQLDDLIQLVAAKLRS